MGRMRKSEIGAVNAAAREVGMSYGQYVALAFEEHGYQPAVVKANTKEKKRDGSKSRRSAPRTVVSLTEKQIKQFVWMYNAGYSDGEIAKAICVPRTAVQGRRSARLGAPSNRHNRKDPLIPSEKPIDLAHALRVLIQKKTPEQQARDILVSYCEGGTTREIGRRVGVSCSVVSCALERFGLPTPYLIGGGRSKKKNPKYRPLTMDEIDAFVGRTNADE